MKEFDNQIRERKKYDNDIFSESIADVSDSILGENMSRVLKDESDLTKFAIEEVCRYYNIKSSGIPDSITDFNMQLEYYLRPNGISRRNINLDKDWYKYASGAIIGTRKEDESVVAFIPNKFGYYTFFNRETGKRERVNHKNQDLFNVEALAFYFPFPLKKLNIKDIVGFMGKQISIYDAVFVVLFMAVTSIIGLMLPKINNMLFGVVIDSGSINLLAGMGMMLICITFSQVLFGINSTLLSARISIKMKMAVNGATMMRIMSLPSSFFKKYTAGELNSYAENMGQLCNMLTSFITDAGLTSLFSLVYIGSILKYAPGMVVPAMIIMIVTVVFSIISTLMQMKISKKKKIIAAKESGLSYALISGVQKIKLAGAEKRAFAKWTDIYAEEAALMYNPPTIIKANLAISTAITSFGAIVLYYAAIKSGVSVAEYYAFNTAYGIMSASFLAVSKVALQVAEIKPILEMVKPIMETEPEISENRRVVTKINGDILLDKVSFTYDENVPNIIDDLSLHIEAGQYVAIVGKTGCGKSTLVRLLLGFEQPNKGAIYYDQKNMNTLDLKSLRKNIGVVLQSGSLINDDIYSNITISAPYLTVEEAWEAAEIAGIADDIRKMPMGMHTLIGEGSGGISGGQKQRLMIARAIAPKPKLLIFDEATSALDNLTQKKVSEALDQMECTRIVIAHRLSTIKECDRIIYLEDGHIVEDGSYEELINKDGLFAELVRRQQIDQD